MAGREPSHNLLWIRGMFMMAVVGCFGFQLPFLWSTSTKIADDPVLESNDLYNQPLKKDRRNLASHKRDYVAPFHSHGGIFFFHHIPKTGGSTIRAVLREQVENREEDYLLCTNLNKWENKFQKTLVDYITNNVTKTRPLFVEIHPSPSFVEFLPQLVEWKELARQFGIPFFAFTVLRDPLSLYVSSFNFWRVRLGHANGSEEDFQQYLISNPTLECLTQGPIPARMHYRRQSVEEQQIHIPRSWDTTNEILQQLVGVYDWIGTTDTFNTQLLPLVTHLAQFQNQDLGIVNQGNRIVTNVSSVTTLSPSTLQLMKNMSQHDQYIYDHVRHVYQFQNEWKDYLEGQGALTKISCVHKGSLGKPHIVCEN